MVAYAFPDEERETYTLTGTGAYTLTTNQRTARSLTILAELVLLRPPARYFNFVYPEPQSFWGYVQFVARDYIVRTVQLEYRRQLLYESDYAEGERNRQMLCLLWTSQELAYRRLLDLLEIGEVAGEDLGALYSTWRLETEFEFLSQVRTETALWYEVVPGYALQLSLIWIPHWGACRSDREPLYLPPPRGTAKDEQRPNDGGGGQQPVDPPPVDRRSDPLSDSPAPPPESSSAPPSPLPAPPAPPAIVRADYRLRLCVFSSSLQEYRMRDSFGFAIGPGPFSVLRGTINSSPAIWVVDAAGTRTVVLTGQPATVANGCPEDTSVTILSQTPV